MEEEIMNETKYAILLENEDSGKTKNLSFNDKQIALIQLALEVFIDMLAGKSAPVPTNEALRKMAREYAEELFASVHAQGG
jgi:hypothetical protein